MKASFVFTPELQKQAEELVACYPKKRAALLPLLWLVQEQEGWVPEAARPVVAAMTGVTEAEVAEVVSFYTMFCSQPRGRHHIQICDGICCRLRGSAWLVELLCKKLNIEVGQTTADSVFHLSTVECLGSCGTAPMMQIGDDYYEDLDEAKVDEILTTLRR